MHSSEKFRPKKDFLYDVVTHTVMLDNELETIFRNYFGLEVNYDISGDGSLTNAPQIDKFERYFMQNMGASSKLDLLKEILEECHTGIKFPISFDQKFHRFYKIRNIFAHSMYPKEGNKKNLDFQRPGNTSWDLLYNEHLALYKEIIGFVALTTVKFA